MERGKQTKKQTNKKQTNKKKIKKKKEKKKKKKKNKKLNPTPQPLAGSVKCSKRYHHLTERKRSSRSVRFRLVQYDIYASEKAHMRFTPSLKSFPNIAFKTLPTFV